MAHLQGSTAATEATPKDEEDPYSGPGHLEGEAASGPGEAAPFLPAVRSAVRSGVDGPPAWTPPETPAGTPAAPSQLVPVTPREASCVWNMEFVDRRLSGNGGCP